MIVGIGVDVVDLARFERAVSRTPRLLDRLFAVSERMQDGRALALHSLAARFAAKEAFIKALGSSDGLTWHDLPVRSDGERNPYFDLQGGARALTERRGIRRFHLSMTHDAGVAIAYVVAEADDTAGS